MIRILADRPDVVMCSTQPPVIGAASAQFACGLVGSRFVYHLQDIHPEVAWVGGQLNRTWTSRILRQIDVRTCRRADHVVVLSADMAETIVDRVGAENCAVHVIPNFNLPDYSDPDEVPNSLRKPQGTFRFLFAGNIGHFQNLGCVVEAALIAKTQRPFELVLMGEGKAKKSLEELVSKTPGAPVRFLPFQPLSIAEPLMAEADVCVVSLLPEVYKYAFPSKVMSYLAMGCPVFVIAEQHSQLGRLPVQRKIGYSCESSPVSTVVEKIESIVDSCDDPSELRAAAREVWEDEFSGEMIEKAWTELLRSCFESERT